MTYFVVSVSYQGVGNEINAFANGVAAQARTKMEGPNLTFVSDLRLRLGHDGPQSQHRRQQND